MTTPNARVILPAEATENIESALRSMVAAHETRGDERAVPRPARG